MLIRTINTLRHEGWFGIQDRLAFLYERWRERRLDRRWGVETTERISAGVLDNQISQRGGYAYQGVSDRRFRRIMRALRHHMHRHHAHIEQHVFVDVGAGKGRALLLACALPWRAVVGVELSTRLCEVAQRNIRAFRQRTAHCPPITILNQDALLAELPAGPAVVFLYNPFQAHVLSAFVERLLERQSITRTPVWIAYCNPVHERVLQHCPGLETVQITAEWSIYHAACRTVPQILPATQRPPGPPDCSTETP